jgi:hypothetical protein
MGQKTDAIDITFDKRDFTSLEEQKRVEETGFREEGRKERARETISFVLVFGLLALFLSSFIVAGTVDEAIKLIQAISSALTGLIGAVLGYYFGATTAEKKEAAATK